MSAEIVRALCIRKYETLQKHVTQLLDINEAPTRKLVREEFWPPSFAKIFDRQFDGQKNAAVFQRWYVNSVLHSSGETAEQLLSAVAKLCANLKASLLPRLDTIARDCVWKELSAIISYGLRHGNSAEYYNNVQVRLISSSPFSPAARLQQTCEALCRIIGVDWRCASGVLMPALQLNRLHTEALILAYYGHLADLTTALAVDPRPRIDVPKVRLRLGYRRAANRQIVLSIHGKRAHNDGG